MGIARPLSVPDLYTKNPKPYQIGKAFDKQIYPFTTRY